MNISIDDLKRLMRQEKINLIDIRPSSRYTRGSIEGAINIPADKLINAPGKYLSFSHDYYLFCEHGYTSKKVSVFLNKLGYHVYSVEGGFSLYNKKR